MERIDVAEIRRTILRLSGDPRSETRGRIPVEYSTHPNWLTIGSYKVKVLSTAEARALRPNSLRPHRIFVWDDQCSKWQYAGKYEQHKRMTHKEKEN